MAYESIKSLRCPDGGWETTGFGAHPVGLKSYFDPAFLFYALTPPFCGENVPSVPLHTGSVDIFCILQALTVRR